MTPPQAEIINNPETLSPCVSICILNSDKLCLGCFRYQEEITAWSNLSRLQRQQVLDLLPERAGLMFHD
ncbi:MAG: DUF1289 domain-containing protein [Proteobacteria bacterium]|nr:DUF1289 domain-containing protein [Pseudomonadota bacterium]